MKKNKIDCVIPYSDQHTTNEIVNQLKNEDKVNNIFILSKTEPNCTFPNCKILISDSIESSETIKIISENIETNFFIFYTKNKKLQLGQNAIDRLSNIAQSCNAGLVYSDHFTIKNGIKEKHPLIDYQIGSVRDDFDFGPLLLLNNSAIKNVLIKNANNFKYAGLYDIRLKISQKYDIIHINESLYTEIESDNRSSGEKQDRKSVV